MLRRKVLRVRARLQRVRARLRRRRLGRCDDLRLLRDRGETRAAAFVVREMMMMMMMIDLGVARRAPRRGRVVGSIWRRHSSPNSTEDERRPPREGRPKERRLSPEDQKPDDQKRQDTARLCEERAGRSTAWLRDHNAPIPPPLSDCDAPRIVALLNRRRVSARTCWPTLRPAPARRSAAACARCGTPHFFFVVPLRKRGAERTRRLLLEWRKGGESSARRAISPPQARCAELE